MGVVGGDAKRQERGVGGGGGERWAQAVLQPVRPHQGGEVQLQGQVRAHNQTLHQSHLENFTKICEKIFTKNRRGRGKSISY